MTQNANTYNGWTQDYSNRVCPTCGRCPTCGHTGWSFPPRYWWESDEVRTEYYGKAAIPTCNAKQLVGEEPTVH